MTNAIILAAVANLPQDVSVLARAVEISAARGADLHVAHVLDLPGDVADLHDGSSLLGQAALAAREKIEAALFTLGTDPQAATIHIMSGSHALQLIDLSAELAPDLIVMRAHQKLKITERLLGSTTDRVIAAADVPVLVVKRPVEHPYGHVVLATNGADGALAMSRFVSEILPGAELTLVQAVQIPPQLKEAMLRVGSRKAELTAHRKKLVKAAEDYLGDVTSRLKRRVATRVLQGDPLRTLTRLCKTPDVDLITVGQGRDSLIRRAFIGSVSRRLLRDARCDVLIWCPSPADTQAPS
ncbi:universal stress protein [Gymnodinialimonas sp. 57CJ19]|uniref:universal stress protein n=1 Tax=Gymnodinialimonas sp. 57CJ19 TaxID=3138498 RepID=UPI0031346535